MRQRLRTLHTQVGSDPGCVAIFAPARAVALRAVMYDCGRLERSECGKRRGRVTELARHGRAAGQIPRIHNVVARLVLRCHAILISRIAMAGGTTAGGAGVNHHRAVEGAEVDRQVAGLANQSGRQVIR